MDKKTTKTSLEQAKKLVIAIDGFSSCGKSTLAKDLTEQLGYTYIDSGAMYRAVSLFFLDNNVEIDHSKDYSELLHNEVHLEFTYENGQRVLLLNSKNVEYDIRSPRVASVVSEVAANSSVRQFLVKQQRALGQKGKVIMDGRDIGTVVFPDADLKFFVTADVDIRAQRRFDELIAKGLNTTLDQVKENLTKRDHIDSTREDSPLVKAVDAIEIDTSNHTRSSQMKEALEHIMSALETSD